MLISPHHNYNCNYTTLQLRHRLVRYYWYVYLYIYIVHFTLYATDWRFRIFSLNFSIKMTPSMTVHVIHLHQQYTNPEKPQVWALTSRCIQRDPFMVPKSSQGAPLSSYQPTKQTQPLSWGVDIGNAHRLFGGMIFCSETFGHAAYPARDRTV